MPYRAKTKGDKRTIHTFKGSPEGSPEKKTMVDKEKLKGCAGDLKVIAEDLQVTITNIKSSDDALMFSWLGPAREYFFDMSTCVQNRIGLTSKEWEESGQLLETVVIDRGKTDEEAAKAAQ